MEINKPTKTTYFICKNEDLEVKAYGIVEPSQIMTTEQPNVKTYMWEWSWLNELAKNGIYIND